MARVFLVCLVVLTLSFPTDQRAGAEPPPGFQTLAIGDAAPDFKLPGIDGKDWTLQD